jgi:hypothetical protein
MINKLTNPAFHYQSGVLNNCNSPNMPDNSQLSYAVMAYSSNTTSPSGVSSKTYQSPNLKKRPIQKQGQAQPFALLNYMFSQLKGMGGSTAPQRSSKWGGYNKPLPLVPNTAYPISMTSPTPSVPSTLPSSSKPTALPLENYTNQATTVFSQLFPNQTSVALQDAGKLVGLAPNKIKGDEALFLKNLDKDKNQKIDVNEFAAFLSDADQNGLSTQPIQRDFVNNGVADASEIKSLIGRDGTVPYLLNMLNETNLSPELKKAAAERIKTGAISVFKPQNKEVNLLKNAVTDIDRYSVLSKSLMNLNQSTAVAEKNITNPQAKIKVDEQVKELFFTKIATDGEVGLLQATDNGFTYTTGEIASKKKNTTDQTETTQVQSNISQISKQNLMTGNFKQVGTKSIQKDAVTYQAITSKPEDVAKMPLIQDMAKNIQQNVLTPDVVNKLVANIDLSNPESIKQNLEPLVTALTQTYGIDTNALPVSFKIENNTDMINVLGKSSVHGAYSVNTAYLDNMSTNLKKSGVSDDQAKKTEVIQLLSNMVHETFHLAQISWNDQLEKGNAPDFIENLSSDDKKIVTDMSRRDNKYLNAFVSQRVFGDAKEYAKRPLEVGAYTIQNYTTDYLKGVLGITVDLPTPQCANCGNH